MMLKIAVGVLEYTATYSLQLQRRLGLGPGPDMGRSEKHGCARLTGLDWVHV